LQALATLADAEHSEAVLQAVMAVRSTGDADLKALANSTASTLIRRFGVRAVGRSTALDVSVSRPAPQSLLYESTPNSHLHSSMASTPNREDSGADTRPDNLVAEAILDASVLVPGMVLAERYRVGGRLARRLWHRSARRRYDDPRATRLKFLIPRCRRMHA
jgi:hypothetical protein